MNKVTNEEMLQFMREVDADMFVQCPEGPGESDILQAERKRWRVMIESIMALISASSPPEVKRLAVTNEEKTKDTTTKEQIEWLQHEIQYHLSSTMGRVASSVLELVRAKADQDEKVKRLVEELRNIADANPRNFVDGDDFREWAKSRARHALAEVEKS